MYRLRFSSVAAVFVIAAMMAVPLSVSASPGSVSIRDLAHLSANIKFPGSGSYGFRPIVAQVQQGGTVVFTNTGGEAHTVSSWSFRIPIPLTPTLTILAPFADGVFDSSPLVPPVLLGEGGPFPGQLNPGDTFTLSTGSLPLGSYNIYCKFHPWMVGVVRVSASGPSGATVSEADSAHFTARQFFAGGAAWGFFSRTTEVKQGAVVMFTNDGYIPHTVTSGIEGAPGEGAEFNSGFGDNPATFIYPGTTFAVDTSTLSPGSHPFFCDIHPWMRGELKVDG